MHLVRSNRLFLKNDENCLDKKKYILIYTIVFLLGCSLVFVQFLINHKSFVFVDTNGGGDGLVIHYNAFVYYGKYLRHIIRSLLHSGKLTIPMWDLSIGYGQDIIQTLWFYAIGDPFAFLSVFIPTRYAEIGYCVVLILELYLAGLSFSYFSRYVGNKDIPTLIGSMIYVFSAYPIYIVTLHPYFSLPMVFFPLLLVGVEKLLNNKFSVYYCFVIALSAASCFYFFYMMAVFVFVYTLIRFFSSYNIRDIKRLLLLIGRFMLNSLLGIGISAIILLPSMYSLLSSDRATGADNYIPYFYSKEYYLRCFGRLLAGGGDYYVYMGYSALAVFVLLFFVIHTTSKHSKKSKILLISLLFLLVGLCVPYFAHLMNGFAYVTNRWIWALDLLIAFLVAYCLPKMFVASEKEWGITVVVTLVYGFFTINSTYNQSIIVINNVVIMYFWIIAFSFLRKTSIGQIRKYSFILVCAIVFLAYNSFYTYSPKKENYLQCFGEAGTAYNELTQNTPGYAITKLDDRTLFRFDTAGSASSDVKRNSSMLLKQYGTSYYFSTHGGDFPEYIKDLELNYTMQQTFYNLDQRSFSDTLLGVKYVVIKEGEEYNLPYGYDCLVDRMGDYCIYSSKNRLPLAFLSNKILNMSQYKNATSVQKQQMLLQGIAAEIDLSEYDLNKTEPLFNDEILDYQIDKCEGITIEGNRFLVKENDACLDLNFESQKDGELYVRFDGLDYNSEDGKATSCVIDLNSAEDSGARLHFQNNKNAYYNGNHSFLTNLGYSKGERSSIHLTFRNQGIYTIRNLEIIYQPVSEIESQRKRMVSSELDSIELIENGFDLSSSYQNDSVLFISVPYSEGWKAYVDGVQVPVVKADSAFLGVPIKGGSKSIALRYRTPLLYEGAVVSFGSVIVFFITSIMSFKKRKGKKK
ncbi:MAG: YfhO family protein [Eubacterium sp.]|nr:YfhO family protein [Eubacterium sp.]